MDGPAFRDGKGEGLTGGWALQGLVQRQDAGRVLGCEFSRGEKLRGRSILRETGLPPLAQAVTR